MLNNLGMKVRRSIENAGGKLFDGFKPCGLTPIDFYQNDCESGVGLSVAPRWRDSDFRVICQ